MAKDDVQKVLGAADEYKRRWNSTWEEQERRLRQNLQICQFNFDLRQVNIFQKFLISEYGLFSVFDCSRCFAKLFFDVEEKVV